MEVNSDIHQLFPGMVKKDVNLTSYNTLQVSSKAHTFIDISDEKDLKKLSDGAFFDSFEPIILGGGSNILIKSDLKKPVLKISISGIEIRDTTDDHVYVKVGAGVNWHQFVKWAVDNNFGGVENLALIPGTVGAAPIQNIGAYGVELEQVFERLRYFDIKDKKIVALTHGECKFSYRNSIFKQELKGRAIVISVTLRLSKRNHHLNTEYYALSERLEGSDSNEITIRDIYNTVIEIRQSKLPDPALIGNAGSFFKNPIIDTDRFEQLKKSFSDVPSYPLEQGGVKVPAGWLIEQAGWKGKRVGNVGTYKNQALVIVNHGGATGEEIFEHAVRIQQSVKKLFGIELTPEVNVVE